MKVPSSLPAGELNLILSCSLALLIPSARATLLAPTVRLARAARSRGLVVHDVAAFAQGTGDELARVASGAFESVAIMPAYAAESRNARSSGGMLNMRSWDFPDGVPLLAPSLRALVDRHNNVANFRPRIEKKRAKHGYILYSPLLA